MNDQQQRDRAFITAPGEWPRWPWLTIKRRSRGGFMECGTIHAGSFSVFDNLYALAESKDTPQALYKYDNVDDLIDDGWMVD